jgi:hypothetical protein
MQSTLSLTLDLTQKKGFFTDTTDYNAIGVDVNTLGATGSVAVYFQGDLLPASPLAINLASGGTDTPLFDLELDVNGEVANGNYTAVYTVDFAFSATAALNAPDQVVLASLGANYQGFTVGAEITVSVDLPGGATITDAEDIAGNLYVTIDETVGSTLGAVRSVSVTQQFSGFSWVYAGCDLVEAKSALVADCDYGDFGTFTVSNETNTTGITINSLTAEINYPSWTNEPVITVTSLPYTNNELATGTYSVTLTQEIEKVQNDGLIIVYTASSIQEFKVSCIGSLCGLNDCLENLRAAHEAELLRNKISKYQVYVDNILIYYTEAQSYKSCGQMDEYRATVAKIEAQLDASGCDCGCCDENQYIWVQNTSPAASSIMQDIIDLQNDVATLQGDVTILQGDVTNLQGDVTTLQGDVTTLQGDVTTIQGDITTIQGDITTIQNDAVFTADNGLTKTLNNVQLGGPLIQDTDITTGAYSLTVDGILKAKKGSVTNSVTDTITLVGYRSNTVGGNGLGSSIVFKAEDTSSNESFVGKISAKWQDVLNTESQIDISNTDALGEQVRMSIFSDGAVRLSEYGSGTFTGTYEYALMVDSIGNIIEKSAPKTYAAVLSQSGTFDPVVTTILDEINITGIVRVSAGVYNVVSLGQFTANKTISIITQGAANDSIVTAQRTSANNVRITTTIAGVATDTLLSGASFKIEVYP